MIKPVLTINLATLTANYRIFENMGAPNVAAVVKADAYGVGITPVVETLLQAGCHQFFVVTPDEGATVRDSAPDAKIMVLGGLYQGGEEFYLEHHLIPVINTLEEMARWRDFSREKNFALPYWLQFDTGMNRLGLSQDEWMTFKDDMAQSEPLHLLGVMSHFIASEDSTSPLNQKQADLFAQIARHFPDVQKSLCNSSGCFLNKDWHYDVLRPGYALYGGNPTPGKSNPMQPVVKLEAPILQTRHVKKGESIGYNATHTFERDTQTATVALGYADGFLRTGSNKAKFYFQGQPCPVRGRVSMDLITIETGHLPRPPRPGEMIEVLGPHQSVEALADDLGTIGYEILTSLGPRYRRDYRA